MLRSQGCVLLLAIAVPVSAQEWRPTSVVQSERIAGITLGKPRSSTVPAKTDYTTQPLPREAAKWQTARYPGDLDRIPEPIPGFGQPTNFMQTRYQGPASNAEEAFNCGQVPGQAPAGGAVPPPAGGAPAPYYGQPAPPPPGGAPAGGSTPWYQPVKDCWNRIFGGGSSNTGIPGTWDARSDQQFKDFISPMSSPSTFEDPRSLTEFRVIGTYQKAPDDNPLLRGASIWDINLQGRISINDQWSLVMHKLSVTNVNPGDGTLGGYDGGTGLNDLQLGFKYTFLRDSRAETLLAFGTKFDIPIGSDSVLAGSGWGMTPYFSYGQGFLDNWHFLATGGYRFGFSAGSSDYLYVSAHLDYGFFKRFYPLVEMNWYYYTAGGNRQPVDFEGGDLMNIGATDVAGRNLVTLAAGFRFKFSEGMQMGVIYEVPIVGNNMLERYRIALDLIFRY